MGHRREVSPQFSTQPSTLACPAFQADLPHVACVARVVYVHSCWITDTVIGFMAGLSQETILQGPERDMASSNTTAESYITPSVSDRLSCLSYLQLSCTSQFCLPLCLYSILHRLFRTIPGTRSTPRAVPDSVRHFVQDHADLLATHNRYRKTMGSLPLSWNDSLARTARDWVRSRLAFTFRTSVKGDVEGLYNMRTVILRRFGD